MRIENCGAETLAEISLGESTLLENLITAAYRARSSGPISINKSSWAARSAFPLWQEGRHPHCHFRGLLGFTHVTARRIAQPPTGDLCHEAPTPAVALMSRSSATGSIDNSPGGFFLH
jgi:hypothetical protein